MSGIMEYVKQYGKRTLAQSSFNEVDNLVMAELSYTILDEVLLDETGAFTVRTIEEAAAQLQLITSKKQWSQWPMIYQDGADLLVEMAEAERYQSMKIVNYVNHVDLEGEEQFSAMTIQLSNDLYYISYRGTDDTIVGWKEDFQMSYKTPIPSQLEALEYLKKTVQNQMGKFYVGGHSKGGNLAVFAAVSAPEEIKKKIVQVYNNDGPGFLSSMMERKEYLQMLPKIQTFLPQSSIVGMLFEHEEEYTVVQSTQVGILQHRARSWQVVGNHFLELKKTTVGSEIVDRTVKNWLSKITQEEREAFVTVLFSLLEELQIEELSQLNHMHFKQANAMVKAIVGLDEEERDILYAIMINLFKEGGKTLAKLHQFY